MGRVLATDSNGDFVEWTGCQIGFVLKNHARVIGLVASGRIGFVPSLFVVARRQAQLATRLLVSVAHGVNRALNRAVYNLLLLSSLRRPLSTCTKRLIKRCKSVSSGKRRIIHHAICQWPTIRRTTKNASMWITSKAQISRQKEEDRKSAR